MSLLTAFAENPVFYILTPPSRIATLLVFLYGIIKQHTREGYAVWYTALSLRGFCT